ncbi:phospholipase [Umezawaea endophytica]|uniref:Phospholipase n=1 Tax=Umezawaea endophytica TaxID=1654476 RepID=A0A9X2VKG2_9PSEU|nr:phospholipase [Umezawaea endophytica]MCS7478166.1 phospholipase [Umezawaea endophytica]
MRAIRSAVVAALLAGLVVPTARADVPAPGQFYLQSVATGLNAAVTGNTVDQHRPKGNEDHQQWNLRSDGRLEEGGRCLGRSGDQAAMQACDSADTRWEISSDGDLLRFKVPGADRYLKPATPLAIGAGGDQWYLTPVTPNRQPALPDGERTLDQVTFLTSHNAYANGVDGGFAPPFVNLFPNQARGITQQLNDGVRGFMLDIHQTSDGAILCHNSCSLVSKPVALWVDVQRIVDFLNANRNEFVTVFLEDYVSADVLRAELARVNGLQNVLFRPDQTGVRQNGWPTMADLRARNQRLLIFTDHGADGRESSGVQYQRDWTVENYWSMGAGVGASDWSCYSRWNDIPLSRTEGGFRRLFVMNHFRDVPMTGTVTDDNTKLTNRAQRFCEPAARKKPTFLAVDHYHLGNPRAAVDTLNTYRY